VFLLFLGYFEIIIGLVIFSAIALTNQNWSDKRACLAWRYSCVEDCNHSLDCNPDINCCLKEESFIWNKVKFYGGIAGLGLSILLAGLTTEYFWRKDLKSKIT